jgi:hypothetical protein
MIPSLIFAAMPQFSFVGKGDVGRLLRKGAPEYHDK